MDGAEPIAGSSALGVPRDFAEFLRSFDGRQVESANERRRKRRSFATAKASSFIRLMLGAELRGAKSHVALVARPRPLLFFRSRHETAPGWFLGSLTE